MEPVYNLTGAAKVLGVSVDFLSKEVKAGRLRARRLGPGGRVIRIAESWIQEYLEGEGESINESIESTESDRIRTRCSRKTVGSMRF